MNYLVIDTETNGLPQSYHLPVTDVTNWPRLISAAWGLYTDEGRELSRQYLLVKPDGFRWNGIAQRIHGITQERAEREGKPLIKVLEQLQLDIHKADAWVGHNIDLDFGVVGAEFVRMGNFGPANVWDLPTRPLHCTMDASKHVTTNREPVRLDDLYRLLMGRPLKGMHDAETDMLATVQCFFELKKRGYF